MSTSPSDQVRDLQGLLVLGFVAEDVERVISVLDHLGLERIVAPGSVEASRLYAFNGMLLNVAGGSRERLPAIDPENLLRVLAPHADEARALFADIVRPRSSGAALGVPWVWGDPALAVLCTFWRNVLGLPLAAVLVHRRPEDVTPRATAKDNAEFASALEQWLSHNRAALVQLAEWPTALLRWDFVGDAKGAVETLSELLERCGWSIDDDDAGRAVAYLDRGEPAAESSPLPPRNIDRSYRVLDRLLDELDGVHVGTGGWSVNTELLRELSQFYGAEYYGSSYDQSGIPHSREERTWIDFFNLVASDIVAILNPRTVLDVGCAIGMLVESLRARGVDARGVDVSPWAIAQVPWPLRPYCTVGSLTDELQGNYDLITCIEVVEHLPTFAAEAAIGNLCRHTNAVLLSSTPDDFEETTHLNVRSGEYWAKLFLRHGFVRDPDHDASFVALHAALFKKCDGTKEELVEAYERSLTRWQSRFRDSLDESAELKRRLTEAEQRRSAEHIAAQQRLLEFESHNNQLAQVAEAHKAAVVAIQRSRSYRYSSVPRRAYGKLRYLARPTQETPVPVEPVEPSYDFWVAQCDTIDDSARHHIAARVAELDAQPLISVVLPTYNTPAEYLRAAIESVRSQIYANWELCIADDCSTEPHVAQILDEYADSDDRITWRRRPSNGHISAASNSALDLANGQWVALLDHDDVLAEHALALAAIALAGVPDAGMLYSDEDKIDAMGRRHSPYFKPDFDPLLLLGQNCISHLTLVRRDLVSAVGGFREGYEGSQDWDLVLRISELLDPSQIVHVPHVLYHWRDHPGSAAASVSAKPYAHTAGRMAVADHLERTGHAAEVTSIVLNGFNRVHWSLPEPNPLVSVIIPTRDGKTLPRCVDSLLSMTTYRRFEVLVVDNGSTQSTTLDYLRSREANVTVIRDERPFNFSALNNEALKHASGDAICLLNDDTEITSGTWLDEMVGLLYQPGVGAVGAKLLYDDGRIQHAGITLGIHGVAGHPHRHQDRLSFGYMGRLLLVQSLSAVTAACMLVRREAWDQVGGFDERRLPVAFNDVDFCLRLIEAGWRVAWTPHAELVHHESISRGPDTRRESEFASEVHYMRSRWGEWLRNDPAYNPNLSLVSENWGFAFPPRVSYR